MKSIAICLILVGLSSLPSKAAEDAGAPPSQDEVEQPLDDPSASSVDITTFSRPKQEADGESPPMPEWFENAKKLWEDLPEDIAREKIEKLLQEDLDHRLEEATIATKCFKESAVPVQINNVSDYNILVETSEPCNGETIRIKRIVNAGSYANFYGSFKSNSTFIFSTESKEKRDVLILDGTAQLAGLDHGKLPDDTSRTLAARLAIKHLHQAKLERAQGGNIRFTFKMVDFYANLNAAIEGKGVVIQIQNDQQPKGQIKIGVSKRQKWDDHAEDEDDIDYTEHEDMHGRSKPRVVKAVHRPDLEPSLHSCDMSGTISNFAISTDDELEKVSRSHYKASNDQALRFGRLVALTKPEHRHLNGQIGRIADHEGAAIACPATDRRVQLLCGAVAYAKHDQLTAIDESEKCSDGFVESREFLFSVLYYKMVLEKIYQERGRYALLNVVLGDDKATKYYKATERALHEIALPLSLEVAQVFRNKGEVGSGAGERYVNFAPYLTAYGYPSHDGRELGIKFACLGYAGEKCSDDFYPKLRDSCRKMGFIIIKSKGSEVRSCSNLVGVAKALRGKIESILSITDNLESFSAYEAQAIKDAKVMVLRTLYAFSNPA